MTSEAKCDNKMSVRQLHKHYISFWWRNYYYFFLRRSWKLSIFHFLLQIYESIIVKWWCNFANKDVIVCYDIRTCQGENPRTLLAIISRTRKERKLDRDRMKRENETKRKEEKDKEEKDKELKCLYMFSVATMDSGDRVGRFSLQVGHSHYS